MQFTHPGGEHGPDGNGVKRWNTGLHRRKFLSVEGLYVEEPGAPPVESEGVFWGEWEPESDVREIAPGVPGGPNWMHVPYYVRPDAYSGNGDPLQNTDPFVFGYRFLLHAMPSVEEQDPAASVLRISRREAADPFGSFKRGEFVLDTVMATDAGVLHDFDSWPTALAGVISETYVDVTMRPTYEWGRGPQLRLYSGSTRENAVDRHVQLRPVPARIRRFPRVRSASDHARRPGQSGLDDGLQGRSQPQR